MSTSTKEKILDTAERLFAERGFDATSLRHIIGEAQVNLAAVHYHFHNKDLLVEALILRKLGPVNERRTAMLDRFEAEAGGKPVPLRKVLEAFILPAFATAYGNPLYTKVLGRVLGEGMMARLMHDHFGGMVERFRTAFHRAVPEITPEELAWRLHFTIGAMAHSLRHGPAMILGAPPSRLSAEEVAWRLVDFAEAGFRVTARQEKQDA